MATTGPTNPTPYPYPEVRFDVWSTLNATVSAAATKLGYTEGFWNVPGSAPLELFSYDYYTNNETLEGLTSIGFPKSNDDQWDCWINHYNWYDWAEMVAFGVAQYYETLGWTQNVWDNDIVSQYPESADKYFDELTDEEQAAANKVCYIQENWDQEETLEFWDINIFDEDCEDTCNPACTFGCGRGEYNMIKNGFFLGIGPCRTACVREGRISLRGFFGWDCGFCE